MQVDFGGRGAPWAGQRWALAFSMVAGVFPVAVSAAPAVRPITVWLIPSEEAEARATTDVSAVAPEIKAFNKRLEQDGGRVRVLNAIPPLDAQLIVFNNAFAAPNWAWVKNQVETVRALQRFAAAKDVRINLRFVTWDSAFADLNLPRSPNDQSPPPDVVQIGSTWAAYFASRGLIQTRPGYITRRGSWEDVGQEPACALPYLNDVRLLFSWARLPTEGKEAVPVTLNTSNWSTLLASLRAEGGPEDRVAFAGGLTLNLFWDYAMLVWSGGGEPILRSWWGPHADLTSAAALQVPELLARNAEGKTGRRLIVVPESSHQALTQAFVAGEYRATIEPANFVSRWKKDFDKTFGDRKRFWDYAAAAAPPQTFHGGSYLAVMPSRDLSSKAFELAEFLATDEEYTRVLARNGHLPSQRTGYGMDVLLDWLGGGGAPEASRFTEAVQQATIRGRRLPDLPEWPTQIESTEIMEAFQRIWRRVGDGNVDGLRREAAVAEEALNLKINRLAQLKAMVARFWWLAVFSGVAVLFVVVRALVLTSRALREKDSAFDQVRRLRGFSANALLALARYHFLGIYDEVSSSKADARKRSVIAAGILGWRRGRDSTSWKPAPAREVIWRAILLAFDYVYDPDIYEQWELSGSGRSPKEFLEERGHLRRTPVCDPGSGERNYFVQVVGAAGELVEMPFLLEQALACLLQNAIQACDRLCGEHGPREQIVLMTGSSGITVVNNGEPIPDEIRRLINGNPQPEEFERAVLSAVRTKGAGTPGIGLTEAYAIATQCYGGLEIGEGSPAVTILYKGERA